MPRRSIAIVALFVLFACDHVYAQQPTALSERARDAERIVLGRVRSVSPTWRTNDYGDRLIVSVLNILVEETLKGTPQQQVDLEIEGGTIGSLTLRVSDEESFSVGDRGVFYLKRNSAGRFVPHLRGQGLLKIDASERIPGTTLTLADVRRSVASAQSR